MVSTETVRTEMVSHKSLVSLMIRVFLWNILNIKSDDLIGWLFVAALVIVAALVVWSLVVKIRRCCRCSSSYRGPSGSLSISYDSDSSG